MADELVTGLIGIGGTVVGIVATWFLGRTTKESDELRTIYATWAAEAHKVVTTVISTREYADSVSAQRCAPIDAILQGVFDDPKRWQATGIDQVRAALEKARFKVVISDENERRVRAVIAQTEQLAKLNPGMPYERLEAAQKALETVVTTELRSSFRLRSLIED